MSHYNNDWRNHRTIKALAERGETLPEQVVFWYNMSQRSGQKEEIMPHETVYKYTWRHPRAVPGERESRTPSTIKVGDEVWVKPPNVQ